jgi:hypothetical protein
LKDSYLSIAAQALREELFKKQFTF